MPDELQPAFGDTPKPLCIYHGTCFDGFTAAWVVRQYYGGDGVDFHAGVYGEPKPDCANRYVIMVDFSYKRPVIEEIIIEATGVVILDHHKTAEADLRDMNAEVDFDMERSGAGIAWDYFFPGKPRPALLNYVEDRDLWRFALPNSRQVHAALSSYDYDFDVWTELMQRPIESFISDGETIERKHFQDIRSLLSVVKREMKIGQYIVPVANMPITMTSDAGNIMAQGQPFAACYWDTPQGRVFSLRSTGDGIDVSEIAKQYGGGGHRNAAGFQMPCGWEGEAA